MIVEGAEMPDFFAGHSRQLIAHIACIAIKDQENRVANKGTATFVMHEGMQFILTAEHVVAALEKVDPNLRLLILPTLNSSGEFIVGEPSPPTETLFPLNVLWRDTGFDAAVLDASFLPNGVARWFPLVHSLDICRRVRAIWRQFTAGGDGSLPFAIAGYAEWGHIRDSDARLEILSALPLFAFVTEWDDAGASKAPQLHLEIVAGSRPTAEIDASALHKRMAEQMQTAESPFGGYSGGPLALFDKSGVHLIGIIKEGGFMYGEARAFCSALDDVASRAGRILMR